MSQRKYTPTELVDFLTALDARLRNPARMIVVGGSAIALHGVDRNTNDIDTFEPNSREVRAAARLAAQDTGLPVEVSSRAGAVGDMPWNSDERFIQVLPELENLAPPANSRNIAGTRRR